MLELSLESWVEMLRWKSVWDDGRRKPWKFGPVHRPPLMQRSPMVSIFHKSFQTRSTCTHVPAMNLLKMHVLRPYPRPPESEALCLWHSSLCFKKPSR